jgi:hypothetical protein
MGASALRRRRAHQRAYQLLCRYFAAGGLSAGAGVAGAGVAGAGVAGFSAGAGVAVAGFSAGAGAGCAGAALVSGLACGIAAFFSGAGVTAFLGAGVGACFLLHPLNVNATNAMTANAVRTTLLMIIPFRKTYSLVQSTDISACQDS